MVGSSTYHFRMETMARNMLQFKSKADQLKQDKATLSVNYEVSNTK